MIILDKLLYGDGGTESIFGKAAANGANFLDKIFETKRSMLIFAAEISIIVFLAGALLITDYLFSFCFIMMAMIIGLILCFVPGIFEDNITNTENRCKQNSISTELDDITQVCASCQENMSFVDGFDFSGIEPSKMMRQCIRILSCKRDDIFLLSDKEYEKAYRTAENDCQREQVISNMRESYHRAEARISDLSRIWRSGLHIGNVNLHIKRSDFETYKMCELANEMGIDHMLDAYYAGVPIEDIVA